jgi:hypothetical protein
MYLCEYESYAKWLYVVLNVEKRKQRVENRVTHVHDASDMYFLSIPTVKQNNKATMIL